MATSKIPEGSTWTKTGTRWRLIVDDKKKEEDTREGKTPQERTMDLILWIGNRQIPGIKLTKDLPQYHQTGKCPMLDLQVWSQSSQDGGHCVIRHSFYQKENSSPLVFHTQGAYGFRPKIVTMAEEFRRRLLNMDTGHSEKDKEDVIKDFLQKMADSGYQHPTRKEIIRYAVTKF